MSAPPTALEAAFPTGALEVPTDLAAWSLGGASPEGIVSPVSVSEVRGALVAAERAGVGVVPLGGCTATGCEPPSRPFVVLSTARLTGIEDYEPADLTVTASAGTTLGDLTSELAAHGQWLPVDPPFAARRTLGGLVATGAAGPLGSAHGSPRDHVLGLTLVTGDGRVLRLGGRVMKNVAGFDLVKLVVGSHGTLGVVVSATVRVFPRPEVERALVVRSARPAELIPVARAVAMSPVVPASAVLLAPDPWESGGAALVVRLQGAAAGVEADEAHVLAGVRVDTTRTEGDGAAALFTRVADHAATGTLVVRATARPASLAGVLSATTEALPDCAVVADVLAGRVRAALADVGRVDAFALTVLRRRLETLGGSLTLERAPRELADAVGVHGDRGRAGALGAAIRARFDPQGLLSPGRFGA
jgi:glycolate oxidase FAD binding subunit